MAVDEIPVDQVLAIETVLNDRKCTKLSVISVARNVKFLFAQMAVSQSFAVNVLKPRMVDLIAVIAQL